MPREQLVTNEGAMPLEGQNFESRSMPEPNSGCWLWLGAIDGNGYGRLGSGRRGKSKLAHRESYELHFGRISPETCVLHRCDTPLCVNPDHLFLGDRAANNRDMAAKFRNRRGPAHHWTKLTSAQVMQIRTDPRSGSVIAAELGINQSTVSRLKGRKRQQHVNPE